MRAPALLPRPPADLGELDHHYNGSRALYDAWSPAHHMHHGYATAGTWWRHDAMLDGMVDRVTSDLDLPLCGRVVDLGCGYGSASARLLAQRPDLRADAVTVLPAQVAFMEEHPVEGRQGHLGDYTDLPFPDEHFDGAFFLESIDYGTGADKTDAIAEAARVLRPGARLVVAGPFLVGPKRGLSGWLARIVEWAFAIDDLAESGPFEGAMHHHGFDVERVEVASLRIAPTVVLGHLRAARLVVGRWMRGQGLDADERRHLTGGIAGLWLGACAWAFQYRVVTARKC